MRQDIFQLLTAADLAQIVLGWFIVIGCIIYIGSKRDKS
jgi:hypothetical protein